MVKRWSGKASVLEVGHRRVDAERLSERNGALVADFVSAELEHLQRRIDAERLSERNGALIADLVALEVERIQ